MNYDGFEFTLDSLSYTKIENQICMRYALGNANDSNLPPELKPDISIPYTISAERGSVSGRLTPYKTADGQYTIVVHSADVSKQRKSR